jgi:aminoglycoside phosphotransferase (APT) family kinase protein
MTPDQMSEREILDHARRLLGSDTEIVARVPVGFGNSNWRVRTSSGDYIAKIGPLESVAKWNAGDIARQLAQAVGVPVPELVDVTSNDHHVVRLYEWIDGVNPRSLDETGQRRLGGELGAAVAALHTEQLSSYSSRLDASGPAFPTWGEYIRYRAAQVRTRAKSNGAPADDVVVRVDDAIGAIVDRVSAAARPVTCHRDLHADNLIVGPDGALRAIIDWDMPEAWDQAGEWFKLEWMLFPEIPAAIPAFETAYQTVHRALPAWSERKRLVHLVETLNVLANSHNAEFTSDALTHLGELLR